MSVAAACCRSDRWRSCRGCSAPWTTPTQHHHRDIKPGNVMLTRNGDIKVMDFGIARAVAISQATMTQANAVMGTAQYLSPEQARGEVVDARSDLYSAGCLMYELLTGRPRSRRARSRWPTSTSASSPPHRRGSTRPCRRCWTHWSSRPWPRTHRTATRAPTSSAPTSSARRPVCRCPPQPPECVPDPGLLRDHRIADPGHRAGHRHGLRQAQPWAWLGIAILLLAVGAAALFLERRVRRRLWSAVTVPNVVGKNIDDAQRILESKGLKLGAQTPQTSDKPEDAVLAQDPEADTQLAEGGRWPSRSRPASSRPRCRRWRA